MKPNTEVALALRHVGRKNEPVMVLTGTFVEVIQQFVMWAGKTYMATRFDMCMGRSEEEARKGLTKVGQAEATETFDLDALTSMMETASSEATIDHGDHGDPTKQLTTGIRCPECGVEEGFQHFPTCSHFLRG